MNCEDSIVVTVLVIDVDGVCETDELAVVVADEMCDDVSVDVLDDDCVADIVVVTEVDGVEAIVHDNVVVPVCVAVLVCVVVALDVPVVVADVRSQPLKFPESSRRTAKFNLLAASLQPLSLK